MRRVVLGLGLVLAAASFAQKNTALYTELVAMRMADQEARARLVELMQKGKPPTPGLIEEVSRIDRANSKRLWEIIWTYGWPTVSLVGPEASHDAWLIAQHADHDIKLQKKALALMEPLLLKKEAEPTDYAYLFDRVAVNSGKKQRYGTQFVMVKGMLELKPLENPKKVDQQRKAIGLPPLEDQFKIMEIVYGDKVRRTTGR